ncbi:Profilin family protein [Zostera marina]|uniref:Profilin family protein n=1 Tax=Zostera marina TaxID=29655 RepID=A0A0K9PNQ3_ZOSMR|nr:Profilin family protein [Zostera marina]
MTLDWGFAHKAWENWADTSIGSSGKPLKAAMLLNYDPTGPSRLLSVIVEQQGIKVKPFELHPFLDFIKKKNSLATCYFFIGSNQYLVTSIHEYWFCARCVNTSKPAGEGVVVMQTAAFLIVAMYEGSIGSASRAMAATDQFASLLNRRNH